MLWSRIYREIGELLGADFEYTEKASIMFEKTLFKSSKKNLALLSRSGILKEAYLAGGTGVALQLGHRVSMDLDFFTNKVFIPRVFITKISELGSFAYEQASKGTVVGHFEGLRFSLFVYKYKLLFKPLSYFSISVADIRDIAAMKIDAISSRGAKRDFVDLYFICQTGYTLVELLNLYNRKYGLLAANHMHIKKSLVFFNDAETDEMPKMLKPVPWSKIKEYFDNEVKYL
jgi:hypothetical protein